MNATAEHIQGWPDETPPGTEVSPRQALFEQARGALLIDVREATECAAGQARGAIAIPCGQLEPRIAEFAPEPGQPILLICATGQRSLVATAALCRRGYRKVASVTGGFSRWQAEGLPLADAALDADSMQRYARQLQLPQVGVAGQQRLAAARIAILGAGGLGSPAALYLAAAGVGHLTLIDDDVVERSNLQRQVLHADARVGMAKTESAQLTLAALNPQVHIQTQRERLVAGNIDRLIAGHDLVIDGSDNFPTRYLLTAASQRLRLPLIYGAVERFGGQLSVFDPRRADSPCYRCLFPEPPGAGDAPNCSEAGVLGVLPGIVGLLQATEALKLILGLGESLVGRLLCFDALGMQFHALTLPRNPHCPGCGSDSDQGGHVEPDADRAAAAVCTHPSAANG